MNALDQILPLLKYIGAIATATYGIYATVTDFHEQRAGKKVLSKKGYCGIALLVLSSLLSFTADLTKDHREKEEARQAKTDLVKHYETIIQDLKQVGGQVARAADPIKDVKVSFCLNVPLDHPKLQAYRERIEKEIPRLSQGEHIQGVSAKRTFRNRVMEVRFDRNSQLFPNQTEELVRFLFLSEGEIELNFFRVPISPDGVLRNKADLRMDLSRRVGRDDSTRKTELYYGLQTRKLRLCTSGISKFLQSSTGTILAVPDLAGSQLITAFHPTDLLADPALKSDVFEVRAQFDFEFLALNMSGGRNFRIEGKEFKRHTDRDGRTRYSYIFPANKVD